MTEPEVSPDEELWSHEIRYCGDYAVGLITCSDRKLGWQIQHRTTTSVLFITGPDILGSEIESYRQSVIDGARDVEVVLGRDRFIQFIEDSSEQLDPLLLMAASYVVRD